MAQLGKRFLLLLSVLLVVNCQAQIYLTCTDSLLNYGQPSNNYKYSPYAVISATYLPIFYIWEDSCVNHSDSINHIRKTSWKGCWRKATNSFITCNFGLVRTEDNISLNQNFLDSLYLTTLKWFEDSTEFSVYLNNKVEHDTFITYVNTFNSSLLAATIKFIYIDSVLYSVNDKIVSTNFKIKSDSTYLKNLIDTKLSVETDPVWNADQINYYTKSLSDIRYPLLSGSYANPSWITSLPQAKITFSGTNNQYVRADGTNTTFPTIPTTTSQLINNSGFLTSADLSGYATTGSLALKGDSSTIGDLKRRYLADSSAKAISLATKLSSESQIISGSGNQINLTGGSSYTIPAQTWSSITSKPTFATVATTGFYSDLIGQLAPGTGISMGSGLITNTLPETYTSKVWSKSALLSNSGIIVTDTFAITSSSPTLNFAFPTGTTQARVLSVVGFKTGANAITAPQVAISALTTTSISLILTQQNTSVVSILGINVLSGNPLVSITDFTGVKVALSYITY